MQMREKVGKSRNTVFSQWFGAPEGRKVGSLKRRVRSQLARGEMKNCTPLWREAHVEVKMYKAHHGSDHFWKFRCRKSARRCGAKHISEVKMHKTHQCRITFGSWDVEKVHAVVARSTFRCQNATKHHMLAPLLEVQMSFRVAGARDCAPCQKWAKRQGFVAFPKTMAGMGHLKRICQDAFSRGRCSTKDMFMRDVRKSGRWFPATGCILEHPICRFAKMILRDRCNTSYDLASIFRGTRNTLDRWSGKIAKRNGTRLSALRLTFYFWRTSRRIALFLMLSCSKIEGSLAEMLRLGCCQVQKLQEVSQNCFVFHACQVQTLRKSHTIAAFLMLSSSKTWETSRRDSFVSFSSLQIDRIDR